jgi:outer membrane lipoprotein-sorting protein
MTTKICFLTLLFFTVGSFAKDQANIVSSKKDSLKNNNSKDTTNLQVPDGLTAKEVIDNYISAIGGAEKIYNIVDRTTVMSGTMQRIDIKITIYQKAPNKYKELIKVGGDEQAIIFDGEKGIRKLADENKEIKGSELEKLKYEATLALLADPEHYGIVTKLDGIEKVNGDNAYKIIMVLPSGIRWTQYYDVKTGLKVRELKYIKAQAGLYQQEIDYGDYRESGGILYPFKIKQILGAQTMEFAIDSIRVNTGLTDREFNIE